MTKTIVDPETLQAALDRAEAGHHIQLSAGWYTGVYTISRRSGVSDRPIVIEPAPSVNPRDCKISQNISAEQFRLKGNRLAQQSLNLGYRFPGLYPWIDDARFRIYRCQYVHVRNLVFAESWPTHIFIEQSQDVCIDSCEFEDATFCIGAGGAVTRNLTLQNCTWTQDLVPDRLWHQIPWHRIHGPDVDVNKDYRLFDGDFFRSNEISGGVTVRGCTIKSAFNAIHGYNTSAEASLNRDFNIYNNRFEQIRDNVFEPENGAANWWFYNNDLIDVHKWFSIECITRGPMYIFSNTGSFRTQQGSQPFPGDSDDNTGGSVFKPLKRATDARGPFEGLYVFHNSFLTRSRYIKKGLLPGLQHFNNAISYRPAETDMPRARGFFGDVKRPEYRKRFTSSWEKWNIAFDGDVIGFPAFSAEVIGAGYPLGSNVKDVDPQFLGKGAAPADFELYQTSSARDTSLPFEVLLPSGRWVSDGGANVGAFQGPFGSSYRFEGPKYEPSLNPTAHETSVS